MQDKLSLKIFSKLIRPLLRFAVKSSLKIQTIIDIVRMELVNIAKEEITKKGERITDSRLSIITGIHRREICKLVNEEGQGKEVATDKISKIIGHWQENQKFTTKQGRPKVLRHKGLNCEFAQLVYHVSKELNPATILFELERVGAIEKSDRGLTLIKQSFVPLGDFEESLSIVNKDTESLIDSTIKNIFEEQNNKNLHVRTNFDNIRPQDEELIKQWLLREGHKFHANVREFLSKFDQDINPDPSFKGKGINVSISSFSNTENKK